MRLTLREWLISILLVVPVLIAAPALWKSSESFEQASDFRIPFDLSNDYWIYENYIQHTVDNDKVAVVGDSVVWGEYVRRSQTLSAALNQLDLSQRYTNCGISGMHPIALEGLIADYAAPLKNTRVILHCNLLWLSSQERDLSLVTDKKIEFNHQNLVPQLAHVPAYKAKCSERLGNLFNRTRPFRKLVMHLRASTYDNLDLHTWTLEHPYENPLNPIMFTTPACNRAGRKPMATQTSDIPWLTLNESLQWKSFQKIARQLKNRGNRLFVVLGPYNEHLLTKTSRNRFIAIKQDATEWLEKNNIFYCAPALLPDIEYGDASHPLAEGYRRIALQIHADSDFQAWKNPSR